MLSPLAVLRRARLPIVLLAFAACTAEAPEEATTALVWQERSGALTRSLVHPALGSARLRAAASGLSVATPSFEVGLQLKAFGRQGHLEPVAEVAPTSRGEALVYIRNDHEEWYRPAADGIEHGVTVARRPSGEGELVVELAFASLSPRQSRHGAALVDAEGRVRAHYTDLHAFDATGRELESALVVDAGRVRLLVQDEGARYPIVIDPIIWGSVVVSSSVQGCDGSPRFGASLSVREELMAVGADAACVEGIGTGATVVFDREGERWVEADLLTRPDSAAGDRFGARLALTEDTLVVSAPGAFDDEGVVEVYTRLGRRFRSLATLRRPGQLPAGPVALGTSLAADASTVLAGAPATGTEEVERAGAVAVFRRDAAGGWTAGQVLLPPEPTEDLAFGSHLALDGAHLAVASRAGVTLYERRGADDFVDVFSIEVADVLGLSLSGDRLAIVTVDDVAVYRLDDAWTLETTLTAAGTNLSGPVSLGQTGAAVATPAGVHFFALVGDDWSEGETVDGSATDALALVSMGTSLFVSDGGNRVSVHRRVATEGEPCNTGTECQSGFCVDGVCCDSACGLGEVDCLACSIAAGSSQNGRCELARAGSVCRESIGTCDATEVCDGISSQCPADRLSPVGVECRPVSGPCDLPEVCTGRSPFCPADGVKAVGTVCRPAAGECDQVEACDGLSATCPADRVMPKGRSCRPRTGVCDVEETCDGESPRCPRDGFQRYGFVCRPATSDCDAEEICTGASASCPADVFAEDGTPCADGDACTQGDVCLAGQCLSGPSVCEEPEPLPPPTRPAGPKAKEGCSQAGPASVWWLVWLLPALGSRRFRRRTAMLLLALGLALPSVSQATPDDADGDGVPDSHDLCPGDDNVDADGDGTPAACDCDDDDPSRGFGAADVWDGIDNDCDGRVDVTTLLSLRGGQIHSMVGRGLAESPSSRTLGTDENGFVTTVSSVSGGPSSDVYFDVALTGRRPGPVHVLLDREHRSGDHDFEMGLFDGEHVWGFGAFDAPGEQPTYTVLTGFLTRSGALLSLAHRSPASSKMDQGPYFITFRPGAEPVIEVRTPAGASAVLPMGETSIRLDTDKTWRLLLWGNQGRESYRIRELAVWQDAPAPDDAPDEDGDGFTTTADCDDTDDTVYPGARELCNERDDDCDGHGDRTTFVSGSGAVLLSDIKRGLASAPSSRALRVDGEDLLVAGGAPGDIFYRRLLPLVSGGDDVVLDFVLDRPPRPGDHDLIVGLSDGATVVGFGLHDDGGNASRTRFALRWGADQGGKLHSPVHNLAPGLNEAPPYKVRLQVGEEPSALITSADGTTIEAPLPPDILSLDVRRPLSLVLVSHSVGQELRVRRLEVSRQAPDADSDGVCDGLDRCVGNDNSPDADGDGVPAACDCDDSRASTRPGAVELCDGIDQDCDGYPDEQRLAGGVGSTLLHRARQDGAFSPEGALVAGGGGTRLEAPPRSLDDQVLYREALRPFVDDTDPRRFDVSLDLGDAPTSHDLLLLVSDGTRAVGAGLFTSNPVQPTAAQAVFANDERATVSVSGGASTTTTAFAPRRLSFSLELAASGLQRLSMRLRTPSGEESESSLVEVPPGSALDPALPLEVLVVAREKDERYSFASLRVSQALSDADGDLVCDAIDRCPGFDDRLDADRDGVPDACDMCLGPDGTVDLDGDGFPNGCDCRDDDPSVNPAAADVCNLIDDDCDGVVDRNTALRVRGAEMLSRIARGEAETNARVLTPLENGQAVRVEKFSGADGDVYYRQPLALRASRNGVQRFRMTVDRDSLPGDHDFGVGVTDGSRVVGVGLYDDGGTGARYLIAPFTGVDEGHRTIVREEPGIVVEEASPYVFDFVLGIDPRVDVTTANGTSASLKLLGGDGGIGRDRLSLVLIGNQAQEQYVVRRIEVSQFLDDADGDGFCNEVDICPGADDGGVDSDGDGIPDACDVCPSGDDGPDSDGDGVPDACDACPGSDDRIDTDGDGIPDGCDVCPDDPANDFDGDGVCDSSDICLKGDDRIDTDGDGIPDACDKCPLDANDDSDEDGTCDSADVCIGDDRTGDRDGDGYCADVDCDDTRAHIHPGAEEICDGFDSNCDGKLGDDELDTDGNLVIQCLEPDEGCASAGAGSWLLVLGLLAARRRRAR